jgi:hypothetical protein
MDEFESWTEIDRVPLAVPGVLGAKVVFTVALCPGANVKGNDGVVTLKPVPLTMTCVTVILGSPVGAVFVKVRDWLLLLPTFTLPKSSCEWSSPRLAWFWIGAMWVWLVPPPQATVAKIPRRASASLDHTGGVRSSFSIASSST